MRLWSKEWEERRRKADFYIASGLLAFVGFLGGFLFGAGIAIFIFMYGYMLLY